MKKSNAIRNDSIFIIVLGAKDFKNDLWTRYISKRSYMDRSGNVDDNQYGFYLSIDGGENWEKILYVSDKAGIGDLIIDPNNSRIIYATTWEMKRNGYRMDSGGPDSKIFRSYNGGDTWEDISEFSGLPAFPWGIVGVAISPVNSKRIWVMVEAENGGLFRSDDGGDNWENASGNMPQTPIVALRINPLTNIMYAATYGNSVYKVNLNDLYVGMVNYEVTNNDFTASFASKNIIIENNKVQSFQINIYTLAGVKIASFSTNLLQKGKSQIDVSQYFENNKGMLLFEIIGKWNKQTLKAY
jgi:hypothetical protein